MVKRIVMADDVTGEFDGVVKAQLNNAYVGHAAGAVDFSTQENGDALTVLDTGQAVDYVLQNVSGRKPQISSGRLVHGTLPASGAFANYYQAQMGARCDRIGTRFVWPTGTAEAYGTMCYALWGSVYEAAGTNVPSSIAHVTVTPGTGATGTWQLFVCDGVGHLFVVKQATFTNPPADDKTPWYCETVIDWDAKVIYNTLPDGQVVTVSDADIQAMYTLLGHTPVAFLDHQATVAMIEHFATTNGHLAKYPRFLDMWADTVSAPSSARAVTPLAVARSLLSLKSQIPRAQAHLCYAPTTQLSVASTTSAANVDNTNVRVVGTAGPTGKLIVEVQAYYEFSAADTLFWRVAGTVTSATRAAHVGVSGEKVLVSQLIEITDRTPGSTVTCVLQHWTASNGSATLKAGGSGGGMVPPVTMHAIPL